MAYVDISGISDEFLEFMGYDLRIETHTVKIYHNKGEYFIVKKAAAWLKVDDDNDAAILRSRRRVPVP